MATSTIGRILVIICSAAMICLLSACDIGPIRRALTPAVIHSAEKNSPYSVLEGTTVRIEPHGAKFDIPEAWLIPKPAPDEHIKNIFLSWDDLNEVDRINREPYGHDSEGADVINSVLPFEDCVAHVGDRGWGNGLWNDLQARVYITDLSHAEVVSRFETDGLSTATANFERAKLLASSQDGDWEKHALDIIDAPTHFILGKRIDFYIRRFNDKTVVFVFIHADSFKTEITNLLSSFRWSK